MRIEKRRGPFKMIDIMLEDDLRPSDLDLLKKDYHRITHLVYKGIEAPAGFRLRKKVTPLIDLSPEPEAILFKFRDTVRNEIHRTERLEGFEIKLPCHDLSEAYELYKNFEFSQGRAPVGFEEFSKFTFACAYYKQRLVSAVSFYQTGERVRVRSIFSLRLAARDEENGELYKIIGYATKALVFAVCKFAKGQGAKTLDLASINLTDPAKASIAVFKNGFGADLADENQYIYERPLVKSLNWLATVRAKFKVWRAGGLTLRQLAVQALRWSEKITRTDMVYLAKGGGWMLIGRIVAIILGLLLSIAFANLLPKEVYGTYKYLISILGILTIFTLSSMGTAVTQSVAKGFDGSLSEAVWAEIKWGLIGAAGGLGLAAYYLFGNNSELGWGMVLVALFVPFTNVYNLYDSVLQGKRKFDLSVKYGLIIQLAYTVLQFLALFLTRSLFAVLLVNLLTQSLFQGFFYVYMKKKIPLNREKDPSVVKYGLHLSVMNVLAVAAVADQVLLFHFGGAAVLAVYAIAIAPAEQLKGVLKIFGSLSLPKYAAKTKDEIKSDVIRKTMLLGIFIAAGVVVYVILAPFFYHWFLPKYTDAIFYSQIYAISLISFASFLPTSALQAMGSVKELYKLNISSTILQLVLLVVGIYFWGIWGAILGRLLARFIAGIYSLQLVQKA